MSQRKRNPNLEKHLFFRLPDVFQYLLSPSLWMTLVGLAILSSILQTMGYGIFGFFPFILAIGLEVGVFFRITRSSANGDTEFSAPDYHGFWDNVIHPIFLVLFSALPILIALYWGSLEFFGWSGGFSGIPLGPLALLIAGLALYPLLLTVAAIDGTYGGIVNPAIWANALVAFRSNYLVAAVGFYGLWYLEATYFAELVFKIQGWPLFGASVLAILASYIPVVLRYRLLGALCEPYLASNYAAELPKAIVVSPPAGHNEASDNRLELESGTMTAIGILRMANKAFSNQQYQLVYRATESLWKQHRDSPELIDALWLSAQSQEGQSQIAAMKATMQKIISLAPDHPCASQARIKLHRYES